ncbi:MAG: energy transducer TonB [Acidobacteriota bacterium]
MRHGRSDRAPDDSSGNRRAPAGFSAGKEGRERTEPDYPEVARKAGIQGVVMRRAVIGTAGQIEGLRVHQVRLSRARRGGPPRGAP